MSDGERVTYRSVLANREYSALLVSHTLSILGDQIARIAIAIVVYDRTGSAIASSATYAISYLTYLIGGPFFTAISDRRPRVPVMIACDLLRAPAVLALCAHSIPIWVYFIVLAFVGALSPPFDSARSAIQPEILDGDAYVVGNGLMAVIVQLSTVFGFVTGGALVSLVSARGALAIDAGTFLVSAGVILALVATRPAAQSAETQSSLLLDAWKGFVHVRRAPELRRYLAYSVITSAAVIAPEGLAVPTAKDLGVGNLAVGLLTASIPAGTVLGGVLVLRLPPERRLALLPYLSLLCGLPLVASPLMPDLTSTVVLWTVSGLGNCVTIIASAAYMQACPSDFRARAYGVAVTALQVTQGLVLLGCGWLADAFGPRGSVALLAGVAIASIAATPVLRPQPGHSRNPEIVRGLQG